MSHRLRRRYGRSSGMLTFGVVPPFAEFQAHIRGINPDDGKPYLADGHKFSIEAGGTDHRVLEAVRAKVTGVGDYGKPKYEFTAKQLHSLLKKLVRKAETSRDEELQEGAQSLSSAIMSTLGYEWA